MWEHKAYVNGNYLLPQGWIIRDDDENISRSKQKLWSDADKGAKER